MIIVQLVKQTLRLYFMLVQGRQPLIYVLPADTFLGFMGVQSKPKYYMRVCLSRPDILSPGAKQTFNASLHIDLK